MSEYSKKDIFDELRTGSHISIGHPMWTYIVENQEELSDYFSDLEIELEIVSDVGYCFFKTSNSNDPQAMNIPKLQHLSALKKLSTKYP